MRDADFRALYDAAIVAVHRNGARVTNKVGDIRLHAGDTLLLQTGAQFAKAFRNKPDFYLVSDVEDSRPVRFNRAWLAAIIFIAMITAFVSGRVDIMLAGFLAAGAMVATGCISAGDARKSVDLPVLIAIAASFGVGKALEQSGVAKLFAGLLVEGTRSLRPDGHAGSDLLRNDGPQRVDQQQRRRRAFLSVLPRIGAAAGGERAPVHHGRDPGRLVCLRLTDRLPDSHDGLRARRVPLHRLHARRNPVEPVDVHRRGHSDPADLAVLAGDSLTISSIPLAMCSIIPFQLEHPVFNHALGSGSELLSG